MLNTGLLSKITGRSRIISGQDYYISVIALKIIKHQRDITSLLRTAERFYARGGRADGGGRPEQRDVQTGDY